MSIKITYKTALKDSFNESQLIFSSSAFEATHGADAALILTEWDEFKHLDWKKIYNVMRKPAWIFDSRICLDRNSLIEIGFKLWTLGSPSE